MPAHAVSQKMCHSFNCSAKTASTVSWLPNSVPLLVWPLTSLVAVPPMVSDEEDVVFDGAWLRVNGLGAHNFDTRAGHRAQLDRAGLRSC